MAARQNVTQNERPYPARSGCSQESALGYLKVSKGKMHVKIMASGRLRPVTGIVAFLVVAIGVGNMSPASSAPVAPDQQHVVLGTFSLDFNQDWQLLDSEKTRAILQIRSRATDGGACPGRLILAMGEPFFKATVPELPSYTAAWGKLSLVSPNAKLTGYATAPQEHGIALYENRLRIEYWCLNDLRAIQRIAQLPSTK